MKLLLINLLRQEINSFLERLDVGTNLCFGSNRTLHLTAQSSTRWCLNWQLWLHGCCVNNHRGDLFTFGLRRRNHSWLDGLWPHDGDVLLT